MKFRFDWPSRFREKMIEDNGHIHVYRLGAGEKTPGVNIC